MESVRADITTKDIVGFLYRNSRSANGENTKEFLSRLVMVTMELYLEASLIVPKDDVAGAYLRMRSALDGYFYDEKTDGHGNSELGLERGDAGLE